jgi:hypothetical protein
MLKVFKGTDKDMKCRGMQYEIGKTEVSDDAIRCGNKGFHSCEIPFDVLRYYPAKDGNRFFVAKASGEIDREDGTDSKLASSEIALKTEINFAGLVKAQIEYTRKKAKSGIAGGDCSNLAGGAQSNLAGGDWSNLAGGNRSNLAGGYGSNLAGGNRSNLAGGAQSNLAGGDSSLIVGRNAGKAKGGLHSVIVLTAWDWNENKEYIPVCVKAEIVDGEKIKPDTWYTLKDGEFAEWTE